MTTPLEKTIQQVSAGFEGVFQTQEAERERRQKEAQALAIGRGPTFGEVLQRELPDLSEAERRRQHRVVGWDSKKFASEIKIEGWRDRWNRELEEKIAAKARETELAHTGHFLEHGPALFASWSDEKLLALVKNPKLNALAASYEPTSGGLLLLGPTGIGKTVALIAIVKRHIYAREHAYLSKPATDDEHLDRGVWSAGRSYTHPREMWVRAFDLPNARLQHGLGEGEAELVDSAKNTRLLVLDDMGWESRRAGADDVVSEIIGSRYDAGRVTLVTSGQRLEAFTERYGDAVVRRIVECNGKAGRVIDAWPKDKP